MLIVLGVVLLGFIVFVQEAQRRVPVQYARSLMRGGRMYRQAGSTHIPLRVNSAGMIPLIFAMSIMILPGTLASYFTVAQTDWVANAARFMNTLFDANGIIYWLLSFLMVLAFTFFYTMVIFQQQNLAETLQKNSGFV